MEKDEQNFRLINTIEVEPYAYAKKKYESPEKPMPESADLWSKYWYRSVADSGLKEMKPIALGSWWVDIESIGEWELSIVMEHELKSIEIDRFALGAWRVAIGQCFVKTPRQRPSP